MKIENLPFTVSDLSKVKSLRTEGESGYADMRTFEPGNIRARLVEYSPDYKADHWCSKGHVVFILEGDVIIEIEDGRKFELSTGMSFQVADGIDAHKAYSSKGAKVLIVD
jgi:quercetin dioxygenase-like cupin family protein